MKMKAMLNILMALWVATATARCDPTGEIEIQAPRADDIPGGGIGKCRITAASIYAWRDWMPVVSKPGPDGGSPLHAKVTLTLDNSAGEATKLNCNAVVVDEKGGPAYCWFLAPFAGGANLSPATTPSAAKPSTPAVREASNKWMLMRLFPGTCMVPARCFPTDPTTSQARFLLVSKMMII